MKLVALGEICRFEYGASLPDRSRVPGDAIVYGSNGPVGSHRNSYTSGRTIIVGRKGSIGQVHYSDIPCWPIDTTYFVDETCTSSDLEWLSFALRHLRLDALNKASGVPGLNRDDAYKQKLWVPDSNEHQRRIATRLKAQLADVEAARYAAQAQVRDAEALRAAVYRDAFANIIPVALPPTFDDAPPGWCWRKLSDMARLESGHTPSRQRPDWWGGDVSWISLTEIRALDGQWVESTQLRTNAEGIANSSARILPRGTVCYSRTASVGFVCVMAQPMATSQDFANWVCGDELEPEFLMHALIRSRKELRDIATGATHKTIYMPQLESFHLCAPGIDEQRRIAQHLNARLAEVENIHTAAAAQLAEIDRLPQRILAQAFAGSA